MHRRTTTATLLVTMAVSALTGCVATQGAPSATVPPTPAQPAGPRPDGSAQTPVVQAPAREALERVGPPKDPAAGAPVREHARREAQGSAPGAATAASAAPLPHTAREHRSDQHERHTEPRRPARPRPADTVPAVPGGMPGRGQGNAGNSHVCALGTKYGGWGKDTPQSVICKDVYGG